MSAKNFIDLSLSTDDEAITQPLRPRGAQHEKPGTDLLLSHQHNGDIDLGFSWEEKPPKRRKKSPVKGTESGGASFRALTEMRIDGNIEKSSHLTKRSVAISKPCDDSDPIIFTSSPKCDPKLSHKGRKWRGSFSYLSDELSDELPEDPTIGLPALPKAGSHLSNRTAALIASLEKLPSRRKSSNPGHRTATETVSPRSQQEPSPISSPHEEPQKMKKPTKPKFTDAEKEAKAREKEDTKVASKAAKEQAREKEKQRKQTEKDNKARDKQVAKDLDEVNKAKWKKDVATPEMIVDLPMSMDGQSLHTQTAELLSHQKVQTTVYNSPLPNVIRWRRKTTAEYNDEMGYWEPAPEKIINEKHVMCFITAQVFVAKVTADSSLADGEDLDVHVLKLKSSFKDCTPIYLIEGLVAWMRKNSTVRNRAYQAAVLSQHNSHDREHGAGGQQGKSRRKKPVQLYVEEDMVEDALLRLQIIHGCLIHHTAVTVETAEWISSFTQHIATIPYKTERMTLETSFCMDNGQVKTGEDREDTFVKMLQETVRVTAPVAYGIAAQYPSVLQLVKGFRNHGPTALEDLKVRQIGKRQLESSSIDIVDAQKTANRNGGLTDARIGPAISKRLYKVFMDKDAGSTDV